MSNFPIKTIEFVKDYRNIKKGESFDLSDQINIIAGDSGSGKSTLVSLIRNLFYKENDLDRMRDAEGVLNNKNISDKVCLYFDAFKDHCSTLSYFHDNVNMHIKVMGSSGGEGAMIQSLDLLDQIEKEGADLVIFDEPDRGLSIQKQIVMSKIIKETALKHPNTQFIITSHSTYFWEMVGDQDITSMDLRKKCHHRKHRTFAEMNGQYSAHESINKIDKDDILKIRLIEKNG